jgi:hypothetical protein
MKLKGLTIKYGISLFALSLLVTGCSSKIATSNIQAPSSPIASTEPTASPTTNPIASPSPSQQETVTTMDFVNLNTVDNRQVSLKLPYKWTATKEMYSFVDSFVYIQDKNKGIRSGSTYTIFDDKKIEIGHYYQIGYYPDQPGATLPNHCDRPSPAYTGETKLGKSQIYIMNCDLPKEQRTDKYQTFDQIYAVIPIEGETNAYNFSLSVPLGEFADRYLKIMKDMLIGNEVGSSQQ